MLWDYVSFEAQRTRPWQPESEKDDVWPGIEFQSSGGPGWSSCYSTKPYFLPSQSMIVSNVSTDGLA